MIRDKDTNEHFLKVIEVLMDGDPHPGTEHGVALNFLVKQVVKYESHA